MLPKPIDPASVTWPADPRERLALGAAWRLRAFAHALALGLRRVPSPTHAPVARRIAACIDASDAFAHASGAGAEPLVQARLLREPLPACASLAEVAIADALVGSAIDAAVSALATSSDADIAAAARRDRGEPFGEAVLDELAADPPNRACLQLLVERWMAAAIHVVGRPGADAELVTRGVKPLSSSDVARAWLAGVDARLARWGLKRPDAQFLGVVLPLP